MPGTNELTGVESTNVSSISHFLEVPFFSVDERGQYKTFWTEQCSKENLEASVGLIGLPKRYELAGSH